MRAARLGGVALPCSFADALVHDPSSVPENFGIVTTTIEPRARANLREIANLIDQVTLCERFEIGTKMEPLNAYVDEDGVVFRNWLIDGTCRGPLVRSLSSHARFSDASWPVLVAVADVIDVKEHLGVDEYVDVTVEPLPVTISPTEIYAFHKLLVQELDDLVRPPAPYPSETLS